MVEFHGVVLQNGWLVAAGEVLIGTPADGNIVPVQKAKGVLHVSQETILVELRILFDNMVCLLATPARSQYTEDRLVPGNPISFEQESFSISCSKLIGSPGTCSLITSYYWSVYYNLRGKD